MIPHRGNDKAPKGAGSDFGKQELAHLICISLHGRNKMKKLKKGKNTMKKLLSTLLAIAMIATMIPTLAFGAVAVDANEPTPLPTDAISVGTRAAFLAYLGIKDLVNMSSLHY